VIDAIGFNTLDGYMYGIVTTAGNGLTLGHLAKISNDGSVQNVGALTGVTTTILATMRGGDFDGRGNLVVKAANSNTVYSLNVATMTARTFTLSTSVPSADLAYVNGRFVANDANDVYKITPTAGTWTVVSALDTFASFYGGNLLSGSNAEGKMFVIDPNRRI
jgi:hypothetical protein